ncbi:hypothetical protein [Aquibacillus kalidii]|uniref:hypothetical protein n=1 Tax=Aquibacillus kalidii TaxID=2762597 RepID=UPI001C98FA46|nr:hypothetical protein [Aquibacillus kalidii]
MIITTLGILFVVKGITFIEKNKREGILTNLMYLVFGALLVTCVALATYNTWLMFDAPKDWNAAFILGGSLIVNISIIFSFYYYSGKTSKA